MSKPKIKIMPIYFFDSQGIIHKEFVLKVIFNEMLLKDFEKGPFVITTKNLATQRLQFISCGPSASLFTRLDLLWLLPFPKIENLFQRPPFWDIKEHWRQSQCVGKLSPVWLFVVYFFNPFLLGEKQWGFKNLLLILFN